ncbi:MAG: hypothetical protein KJO31_14075 [Gammaproteobacteria bacterium]|nr:hypothetical protein [Gammaproteobacteria bacterium]
MDKYAQALATALIATMISNCAMGQHGKEEAMSDEDNKRDVKRLTLEATPSAVGEAGSGGKGSGPVGPGLQQLVDKAKADLMTRMSLGDDAVELVDAAYVTWPDSSLGCSKPGYQYMQVLTHGSRIVLKAGNRLYYYHSGRNRPPFYCERPTVSKPQPYGPDEA